MLAVLRPPGFVDRPDGWVLQARQGLRFALKELDLAAVDIGSTAYDREGHWAARAGLLGLVDNAHPAFAETPLDAKRRNPFAAP